MPLNHTRRATYCITPTRRAPVKHTLCVGGPHHTGRPLKAMLQAAAARAAAAAAADVFCFSRFSSAFLFEIRVFPNSFFPLVRARNFRRQASPSFAPTASLSPSVALRLASPRTHARGVTAVTRSSARILPKAASDPRRKFLLQVGTHQLMLKQSMRLRPRFQIGCKIALQFF